MSYITLKISYPETKGKEKDMVEQAKEYFDGEVVIAEDLMKVEI